MSTLTVSNSGTAWFNDMRAQGKSPDAGWANSPNAAYYASLDTDHPMAKPAPALPSTMGELLKLHAAATDGQDSSAADQIEQQIKQLADASGLPAAGNRINTTA